MSSSDMSGRAGRIHKVKLSRRFYDASASGVKNFEIRKDDRGYKVGDILELAEWDVEQERYTGRRHWKMVSYILRDEEYLAPEYVCLGVFPIPQPTGVKGTMKGATNKMCVKCGGQMVLKTFSRTFNIRGKEIEIRGIEAYVCDKCGEIVYTNAKAKMIERVIDAVNERPQEEISTINLTEAAECLRIGNQPRPTGEEEEP